MLFQLVEENSLLSENRVKTNIGVGLGTILQIIGFFLSQSYGIRPILGLALIFISIPPFIWGCMTYAEGKGYSKWVGLVGIAGLIGLMVLIILPDQQRGSPAHRLQMRKLVGLVSILLGLLLIISGRYFDDLEYADIYRMQGIPLEHPWPGVLMLVGACLILIGLILMLADSGSSDDRQPDAPTGEV